MAGLLDSEQFNQPGGILGRFADFRRSSNIEDRRNETQWDDYLRSVGLDWGGLLQSMFARPQLMNGLPTQLGLMAGLNDIQSRPQFAPRSVPSPFDYLGGLNGSR